LMQRITELSGARHLADIATLPAARCHELMGDRKGQLSDRLAASLSAAVRPAHDPPPRKPDGGLDWAAVTDVEIVEITDTTSDEMKTKKTLPFDPDYAVPPGETLRETMESLGMTQAELAIAYRVDGGHPQSHLQGRPTHQLTRQPIGSEKVTSVPAEFWNALEAKYREQLTKLADRDRFKADLSWLKAESPRGTKLGQSASAIEADTDKPYDSLPCNPYPPNSPNSRG